mgnify:CR=1 FL=1
MFRKFLGKNIELSTCGHLEQFGVFEGHVHCKGEEARVRKVIVTGGAGFIGSHLVERLLSEQNEVTVLDNFIGGTMDNLKAVRSNRKLTIWEEDVGNAAEILEGFNDIDTVFHLAALADIVPSIQEPKRYLDANVAGTVSVLEAARKCNVKRFVYAASSSCYGVPKVYPTAEIAPISPMYPYALSKYLGEECVLHWWKTYGLPVVSLRFFNVYGPRARTTGAYGAVFGVFLAQKLAGYPFTVVGDGSQTRDFTFVSDVVDALIVAEQSAVEGEIFNVGSGNTYTVNQLVDLLGGAVTHIPRRPGEPDCTFADITKIKKCLGWSPKVEFQDGVKVMLENIDHWKTAPLWTADGIVEATSDWFKYLSPSKVDHDLEQET